MQTSFAAGNKMWSVSAYLIWIIGSKNSNAISRSCQRSIDGMSQSQKGGNAVRAAKWVCCSKNVSTPGVKASCHGLMIAGGKNVIHAPEVKNSNKEQNVLTACVDLLSYLQSIGWEVSLLFSMQEHAPLPTWNYYILKNMKGIRRKHGNNLYN